MSSADVSTECRIDLWSSASNRRLPVGFAEQSRVGKHEILQILHSNLGAKLHTVQNHVLDTI